MTHHPIPETGGSWSQDPKTGALTLIDEPTRHPVPDAGSDAAAEPPAATADAAPASRRTPAKAETEKDS